MQWKFPLNLTIPIDDDGDDDDDDDDDDDGDDDKDDDDDDMTTTTTCVEQYSFVEKHRWKLPECQHL